MGRGGGRRGGKSGGGVEDQYGDSMVSQDRGFPGGGGRGGGSAGAGGGGDAGERRKAGGDVGVVRHVPAFLRAHAHLLGAARTEEDLPDPSAAQPPCDDAQDEIDDEEEGLRRLIELDPSLVQQHPQLQRLAQRSEAAALKERGNRAFADGKLEDAVSLFARCIELDPCNEVYFSNRAAALTSLKKYEQAVLDAREVMRLKPGWVKGHARLGAALFGAADYEGSRAAYEAALTIEPNDASLQSALHKAQTAEAREIAEGKHTFKRKLESSAAAGAQRKKHVPTAATAVKNKALLSFDDGTE